MLTKTIRHQGVGGGGEGGIGVFGSRYIDYLFTHAFRTSAEVRSRFLHSSRSVEGTPLGCLIRIRTRACPTAGRRIYTLLCSLPPALTVDWM
jgi:hypothetical protein